MRADKPCRAGCCMVGTNMRCLQKSAWGGPNCFLKLTFFVQGLSAWRGLFLIFMHLPSRIQGQDGDDVGPLRVWMRDVWIPGLAMSRALGDSVARRWVPPSFPSGRGPRSAHSADFNIMYCAPRESVLASWRVAVRLCWSARVLIP